MYFDLVSLSDLAAIDTYDSFLHGMKGMIVGFPELHLDGN